MAFEGGVVGAVPAIMIEIASKIEARVEVPEYDIAEGVGGEVVSPHCA
jgi:hypothetical protein